MGITQESLYVLLKEAFVKSLMKAQSLNLSMNDMFIQVNEGDCTSLDIYDDTDNKLYSMPLTMWDEYKEDNNDNDVLLNFALTLGEIISTTDLADLFNELEYNTPFSIVMVDQQMETIADIYTIDDNNIVIGDDFWEKMDKELDDFFEKLMSDISRK